MSNAEWDNIKYVFNYIMYYKYCSEQEIQREEISSLQAMKTRLKTRVTELEDELKRTKEDFEKHKEISKTQQPDDVGATVLVMLGSCNQSVIYNICLVCHFQFPSLW